MWRLLLVLPLVNQLVAGYTVIEEPRIPPCGRAGPALDTVPDDTKISTCPADQCGENEEIREVLPCCEPTCDNDCSRADCSGKPIFVPSCVCQSGFVRHNGECICPSQCPATEEPLRSCPPNEELQPTPPCCEPTCGNNCTEECRVELVNQPTCVCMPGYVRHEGCCIKADQCPTCGPYARYSDCTPCCESTCTMDCSVVLCLAGCTGPPTCLCQTGYVKHNGVCIKRELCPIEGSSSEQPPFPIGYDHGLGQEINSGGPDVPFVRYPGKTYK
ncbi:hypothetical protein RP20_CCG008935 [Aedes albopictus]|nr:keratin-associated protein 9-1 [Aedes albopictus]KXJ84447.1 hypothetical protein RP20_CCG008935 [Aedes albopictus]